MLIEELESVKRKVDLGTFVTPDISAIAKAVNKHGFDIRLVGGAVRDIVLGKKPKDFDFATDATPTEMKDTFNAEGIKWIATGEKHGTLTALGPQTREPFEITTLRVDTEHTGRHAEVEFTRSWEKDSDRRDLSYNSMSIDLNNGNLYDYHNGLEDLLKGRTRFVGDANSRIQEDYLRILRLFRFSARYGHPIDKNTKDAISKNANELKNISGERIWMELSKILSGPNTNDALRVMQETGVSRVIGLDNIQVNNLNNVKQKTSNPVTVLASILQSQQDADNLRNRYKFSNEEFNFLMFLLSYVGKDVSENTLEDLLVNKTPSSWVNELAVLHNVRDSNNIMSKKAPVFPVTGGDLLSLGMKSGPELGKALGMLKKLWMDSRFTLSKEDLLKRLSR